MRTGRRRDAGALAAERRNRSGPKRSQADPRRGAGHGAALFSLGVRSVDELKGADPEELYLRDCLAAGCAVDRCVLYVYRLAAYYAENEVRNPEKLKWWYWKDRP